MNNRSSARLSMAVAALGDPERSPLEALPHDEGGRCAALYRTALELLPGWLDDDERCRSLWAEEDAELDAGMAAISSGAVTVEEDGELDLAVVTMPTGARSGGHRFVGRRFDGIHPMALHAATERVNVLTVDGSGGRHQLACRYEGWVQFRSRPVRPRVDLRPLAEALTAAEPAGTTWLATPPSDLTPQMRPAPSGARSALEPHQLVLAVKDHLRRAPAAWNPYHSSG